MDFEQIEKYCNNGLSDAEKADFEMQMQTDPDLTDAVTAYRLIEAEMREVPASADLHQRLEQLGKKHFIQPKGTVVQFNPIWRMLAVAACITGLIFVGRWLLAPEAITKEILLARHFTKESVSLTERGTSSDTLYQVEQYFNTNQPEKVADLLKPYLASHPAKELEIILIKSLLRLNQSKEAINLAAAIASGESAFRYEAMILQAIGSIQMNNWNQAQILLRQIPESAVDYSKAQALLKDMEQVKR